MAWLVRPNVSIAKHFKSAFSELIYDAASSNSNFFNSLHSIRILLSPTTRVA